GCDTILRTESSDRFKTKTSAVAPWIKSGLMVALKAIRELSGDHANESTLKSLFLVRCLPTNADTKPSPTLNVQICLKLYSRRTTSKSPIYSLRSFDTGGVGSVAR